MSTNERDMIDFDVFLIHRLARSWGVPVPTAFAILQNTGIYSSYITPCYDSLHTQGIDALIDDITSFAHERGALV